MKKALFALLGLLQGAFGNYIAIIGYCFAFPESEPGSKDYEEDLTFVPFGYLMMLITLIVMAAAIIKLRKKKSELVTFLAAWAVGTAAMLIYIFYIR